MKEQVKMKKKHKIFSESQYVTKYMERVLILLSLQKWILKEFYLGLPRILCIKSLMRSHTYWLQMDHDIKK